MAFSGLILKIILIENKNRKQLEKLQEPFFVWVNYPEELRTIHILQFGLGFLHIREIFVSYVSCFGSGLEQCYLSLYPSDAAHETDERARWFG